MKRILISIFLFATVILQAQILKPCKWTFTVQNMGNNTVKLLMKATLDEHWYIYSQNMKDGGPIKTSIHYKTKNGVALEGKVVENGKLKKAYDENFEMDVLKFADEVIFEQTVKINATNAKVDGYIEFMNCDDSKCLPPDEVKFSFDLSKYYTSGVNATEQKKNEPEQSTSEQNNQTNNKEKQISSDKSVSKTSNVATAISSPNKSAEQKSEQTTNSTSQNTDATNIAIANSEEQSNTETSIAEKASSTINNNDPNQIFQLNTNAKSACVEKIKPNGGSWHWYFLAGFVGGFIALLTPCVFPMLPLTVSFFTRRSKDRKTGIRNAFVYALSIIAIYTLLGFLVTLLFGADALNAMASSAFFNILFFVIFVVFALSFFGLFEINVPSWLISKSDERAEKGGFLGIFFMAFTLALVSFSCTGPIIGSLLVEAAQTGNRTNVILGMLGFSSALALPFGLFAAFPGWLNTLPKSGGWLEAVKKSLGFFELAFALKFLSLVDLAYGKKFLPYELFVGLWVIIFLVWGLYLVGIIKIGDTAKPGKARLVIGVLVLMLSIYFGSSLRNDKVTGTFHTNELLSGIAPPPGHSYIYPSHCPQNFNCIKNDMAKAIERSKQEKKPILIDFTGHACVNCRRMEDNVWSKEPVKELINDKFVLVSLYVDEKEQLPEPEQYDSEIQQKTIRTIGAKWSDYQIVQLKSNAQPLYVLIDSEGNLLNNPVGSMFDVQSYADWLNCGLHAFEEK